MCREAARWSGGRVGVTGPEARVHSQQPVAESHTDYGPWTMDYGPWTMDYGLWTTDYIPLKNSLEPSRLAVRVWSDMPCWRWVSQAVRPAGSAGRGRGLGRTAFFPVFLPSLGAARGRGG